MKFLFNSCPRGGGAMKLMGKALSRPECEALCLADAECYAMEVNGCRGHIDCGGLCWLFTGAHGPIQDGKCGVPNGDRQAYGR